MQSADDAAQAAPFLFNFEELSAEKLEGVGEFTGERLLARRPDAYRAIVRMSAEGLSISAQARALGVSRNTVCAVREREGISIEQEKKDLLRDVRRAARLSVERAIELVPGIQSAKDAAIVAAVMVDKMQLLSGEATSRVEKVEVNQDRLSEMLAALPVLDAEVLPATGPCADAPEQKGACALPAATLAESAIDTGSTDSGAIYLRTAATGATLRGHSGGLAGVETVEGVVGSVDSEGGEGVAILEPPPLQPTDLGEEKFLGKGALGGPENRREFLSEHEH